MGKDTFEVPTLSARPQANALDRILGVAAPAASILGAVQGQPQGLSADLLQNQRRPLDDEDDYDTGYRY